LFGKMRDAAEQHLPDLHPVWVAVQVATLVEPPEILAKLGERMNGIATVNRS